MCPNHSIVYLNFMPIKFSISQMCYSNPLTTRCPLVYAPFGSFIKTSLEIKLIISNSSLTPHFPPTFISFHFIPYYPLSFPCPSTALPSTSSFTSLSIPSPLFLFQIIHHYPPLSLFLCSFPSRSLLFPPFLFFQFIPHLLPVMLQFRNLQTCIRFSTTPTWKPITSHVAILLPLADLLVFCGSVIMPQKTYVVMAL